MLKLIKKIFPSWLKKYIRRIFFTEILAMGDSHASIFKLPIFRETFSRRSRYIFNVEIVKGATVSGLKNPNSKTQALPIFRQKLQEYQAKIVIVLLGEVDTGFVIWYRAEKYQTSVESMLEVAVENYSNLLLEIARRSRVICISTPLPAIEDDNDWGEIANARKEVKATQLERTNLTLEFNKRMQKFCEANNMDYISLDRESLDDNGLLRLELLNSDRNDHHYDQNTYAKLILGKLERVI